MIESRMSGNFLGSEKLVDLVVSQRLLHGRLHREDFAQGQLMRSFGGEAAVSIEDDMATFFRSWKS
jgi:hypothetical protein